MSFGKRLTAYVLVIVSLFMLVGCNSDSETAATGSQAEVAAQGSSNSEKPDSPADLQGKVKQIRGNQVTFFKAEATGPELSEEEKAKRREMMQNLSPEERAQARADRFKVTDETVDMTIPVGIPIVSSQNIGGNIETEELNLADIKQGDFIKFWFDGNSEDIIYVQVSKFTE